MLEPKEDLQTSYFWWRAPILGCWRMLRGELAQRLGGPSITSEGALLSGLAEDGKWGPDEAWEIWGNHAHCKDSWGVPKGKLYWGSMDSLLCFVLWSAFFDVFRCIYIYMYIIILYIYVFSHYLAISRGTLRVRDCQGSENMAIFCVFLQDGGSMIDV